MPILGPQNSDQTFRGTLIRPETTGATPQVAPLEGLKPMGWSAGSKSMRSSARPCSALGHAPWLLGPRAGRAEQSRCQSGCRRG